MSSPGSRDEESADRRMADPDAARLIVQDLSQFRLPAGFRGRPDIVVVIWQVFQSTIFAWSPQPFYGWRRMILRLFGARIGREVKIRPSARITYPWKLSIGHRAWVGDRAELYSLGPIDIGTDAVISQNCYICTGGHDYKSVDFAIFASPIKIGPQAWLASDVFVGPGVSIGEGAVVGVRSLVLGDVAPFAIAHGSPAVEKGRRA